MRIFGNNSDLSECFEVIVDQDAEPVDWDDAIAGFLLACVERRLSAPTKALSEDDVVESAKKRTEGVAKNENRR